MGTLVLASSIAGVTGNVAHTTEPGEDYAVIREHIPPDTTTAETESQITGEQLVMRGLADPNVFVAADGSCILSGTEPARRGVPQTIPLYRSENLQQWELVGRYNPGPGFSNVWAPDIKRDEQGTWLYFTAKYHGEGQAAYRAKALEDDAGAADVALEFGEPERLVGGVGSAYDYIDPNPIGGKLLVAVVGGGKNSISAVDLNNPGNMHTIATPGPGDGTINEAPDAFLKDGRYYLIMSTNNFKEGYNPPFPRGSPRGFR